jgi:hypothetical protein
MIESMFKVRKKFLLFLVPPFCLPNIGYRETKLEGSYSRKGVMNYDSAVRKEGIHSIVIIVTFIYLYCQSKIARIQQPAEYMWQWSNDEKTQSFSHN